MARSYTWNGWQRLQLSDRRIRHKSGSLFVVPWAAKTDWALGHDQERIDMPNQQPEPEDRNPFRFGKTATASG